MFLVLQVIDEVEYYTLGNRNYINQYICSGVVFSSTQGQGTVSYRLKCKNGELINLRSRGYLEVNKQTGQIESFVCINTVLR